MIQDEKSANPLISKEHSYDKALELTGIANNLNLLLLFFFMFFFVVIFFLQEMADFILQYYWYPVLRLWLL